MSKYRRFSLRAFFLVFTALWLCGGWYCYRVRQQQLAVAAFTELGGLVVYENQYKDWRANSVSDPLPAPDSVTSLLGPDVFNRVAAIYLGRRYLRDRVQQPVRNYQAAFANLPHMPGLRHLSMHYATDEDLKCVGNVKSLEVLVLSEATGVTDDGIEHLAGLTNLTYLYCEESQISDDTIRTIRELPNLRTLFLERADLTSGALTQLEGSASLKKLSVGLANNQLTDQAIKAIATLKNLETLYLDVPAASGVQMEPICKLRKLRSLRITADDHMNIDFDGFRSRIPKCSIGIAGRSSNSTRIIQ